MAEPLPGRARGSGLARIGTSAPARARAPTTPTSARPDPTRGWAGLDPRRVDRTSRETGTLSRLERSLQPHRTAGSHTPTLAEPGWSPGRRTDLTRNRDSVPSRALAPAALNSGNPTADPCLQPDRGPVVQLLDLGFFWHPFGPSAPASTRRRWGTGTTGRATASPGLLAVQDPRRGLGVR